MARTAQAALYEAPNGPFILNPLRAVRAGEVLLRVAMATIFGHEIIGVIEVGAGIDKDVRGGTLRLRARQAPGNPARHTQLPPPPFHPGARVRHGQPRTLSLQGDRRGRRRLQQGIRAQRHSRRHRAVR